MEEEPDFHSIIRSSTFTFVIGPDKKEIHVHGAAISELSQPLNIMLTGNVREAIEKRVEWPDTDEETFLRLAQWAYTGDYTNEIPNKVMPNLTNGFLYGILPFANEEIRSTYRETILYKGATSKTLEFPLCSLAVWQSSMQRYRKTYCRMLDCPNRGKENSETYMTVPSTCTTCHKAYNAVLCIHDSCRSYASDFPHCEPPWMKVGTSCPRIDCDGHSAGSVRKTCPRCKQAAAQVRCLRCHSVWTICSGCSARVPKEKLMNMFLALGWRVHPTQTLSAGDFANPGQDEDQTGEFLCHAKLYVLADKYDIHELKQLSFHRLHAAIKAFTPHPCRMDDLATVTRYVFENTVPQDKLRDMIVLYYACMVENAMGCDSLKELIDELPDFAYRLISRMILRLS